MSISITSPASGATVGNSFTVSGSAPGCTNVTVVVTNGTTTTITHSVGTLNGNYSVDFSGVPDGAITITAYCTANGPTSGTTIPVTASAS